MTTECLSALSMQLLNTCTSLDELVSLLEFTRQINQCLKESSFSDGPIRASLGTRCIELLMGKLKCADDVAQVEIHMIKFVYVCANDIYSVFQYRMIKADVT